MFRRLKGTSSWVKRDYVTGSFKEDLVKKGERIKRKVGKLKN